MIESTWSMVVLLWVALPLREMKRKRSSVGRKSLWGIWRSLGKRSEYSDKARLKSVSASSGTNKEFAVEKE